jgi:pyruvate dehydrogenase E2 component (dihydrolipoamide acetyltransferase)
MATEVKMPALGESITEGTITRWLKQEGDSVEADEALLEVSTDKVDTEVPSPVTGTVQQIKAQVDETVQVGAVLAVIDVDGEAAGEAGAATGEAEAGDGEAATAEADGEAPQAEAPQAEAPPNGQQPAAAEPEPPSPTPEGTKAEEEAPEGQAEAATQDERQPAGGAETTAVVMPALGESITEGTITRWLKQEGDTVEADEALFEVSTDKVDTEVPSPVAGTLREIKAQVDETVQVGAEVAVLAAAGAAAPAEEAGGGQPPRAGRPMQAPAPDTTAPTEDGQVAAEERATAEDAEAAPYTGPVSPLVRRLAREHGIDLNKIKGSGSGGRIVRADVLSYIDQQAAAGDGKAEAPRAGRPMQAPAPAAPEKPAPPAPPSRPVQAPAPSEGAAVSTGNVPLPRGLREEVVKATRIRRLIAERMVDSLHVSAQLTTAVEIDMTRVMRLRERAKDAFKQREGVSLSPLPFAVLALMAAIREYPNVNSAFDADLNLHVYKDVNLGVAVDTPKGLYVPVIRNADRLNLSGIARAIADVAKRTRDGKIDPGELSGSTITVTNTGSVGAVWDTPIINQPNAAMFATPAIVRRPVVVDHPDLGETIAVRHMMYGILTYDHRIIDGADAARFLNKVKQVLEAADFAGELGLET